MFFGMGPGFAQAGPREFEEQYHVFSMAVIGRANLEGGDKILMPPSALDTLARMNVEWPMLFQIRNEASGKSTHVGVLEFTAEEGKCHLPYWVMENLLAEEGSMLTVKNVSLPKATFVKFQPQNVDFLDISDPRAVLEYTLRSYSCLTVGDHICVPYNDRNYYLEVKELQPAEAASIIETDCNVDFEAPVGYVEPSAQERAQQAQSDLAQRLPAPQAAKAPASAAAEEAKPTFQAFTGGGQRLDGKRSTSTAAADPPAAGAGLTASAPAAPTAAEAQAPQPPAGRKLGTAATAARPRTARAAAPAAAPAAATGPRRMGSGRGSGKWARKDRQTRAFGGAGHSLR